MQSLQAVLMLLREAKQSSPTIQKLIAGRLSAQDLPALSQALRALGADDVAKSVDSLASGAPAEKVLTELLARQDVLPLLVEMGEVAGNGADLVRMIRGLLRSV
jgi:hypothetical protein